MNRNALITSSLSVMKKERFKQIWREREREKKLEFEELKRVEWQREKNA